jgi:hypothetical protein
VIICKCGAIQENLKTIARKSAYLRKTIAELKNLEPKNRLPYFGEWATMQKELEKVNVRNLRVQ